MSAVTPTDRPKPVRNSCVIKVFGGIFMLSRCFLDCSVGVGVFVTGLSQISSFFSYTLNFCFNLVQYRFKNMYLKESLIRSSTVILSTNKGGSKAKRISSRRA